MAYARTGHAEWKYEYMGDENIYTYDFDQNQYAYCMLYDDSTSYNLEFKLCARKLNEGGDQRYKQNWKRINISTGEIDVNQNSREYFNLGGSNYNWGVTSIGDKRTVFSNVLFSTTLPIFHSVEDVNHYMQTGDTSKADKDVKTNWNLYIDGTKNPLYKLTWDCSDIPSSDT